MYIYIHNIYNTYIWREIYCKELVHVIMEAEKFPRSVLSKLEPKRVNVCIVLIKEPAGQSHKKR